MIIDKRQQDRLDRVENDILWLENLLYKKHISLSNLFFLLYNDRVDLINISIIPRELDLTLNGKHPLVKIILRFGCKDIFTVLIFDLEAVFVLF